MELFFSAVSLTLLECFCCQVYLAKWKETLVAAKILLNTGVDVDGESPRQVLTLSNPLLLNLQKVRRLGGWVVDHG